MTVLIHCKCNVACRSVVYWLEQKANRNESDVKYEIR